MIYLSNRNLFYRIRKNKKWNCYPEGAFPELVEGARPKDLGLYNIFYMKVGFLC
jgi:hypothetical protein